MNARSAHHLYVRMVTGTEAQNDVEVDHLDERKPGRCGRHHLKSMSRHAAAQHSRSPVDA